MRPINAIVDATNYVMLELGQPCTLRPAHLKEHQIIVRRAEPTERITTLDGQEHALEPSMLMIAMRSDPSPSQA
jgi:phenylalanyl-tRNA synthetase beta subunit (EC 6.1.1.20)